MGAKIATFATFSLIPYSIDPYAKCKHHLNMYNKSTVASQETPAKPTYPH